MKQTALHCAAKEGKYGICRLLVDHGADVNARDIGDKTPLYYALKAKRSDIVKMFMATKTGPLAATHLRYNTLEEGVEFLQLFDEAYSPTENKERDMLGRRTSVYSPAKLGMARRMSVAGPVQSRMPLINLHPGH